MLKSSPKMIQKCIILEKLVTIIKKCMALNYLKLYEEFLKVTIKNR